MPQDAQHVSAASSSSSVLIINYLPSPCKAYGKVVFLFLLSINAAYELLPTLLVAPLLSGLRFFPPLEADSFLGGLSAIL
jgi:hypothetical protein